MTVSSLLRIAAAAQLAIALLNLFLVRLLDWKADLDRLPLLLREVFHVHCWFISFTLGIFGVMTLRFADAMAASSNETCRWLTAGIGIFWAIRTVLQVTYYSSGHWHGRPVRTAMHVALLATYGGLALVYSVSAFGKGSLFWLLRGGLQLFYSLSTPGLIDQLQWLFMAVDGCLALVYGLAAWAAGERN